MDHLKSKLYKKILFFALKILAILFVVDILLVALFFIPPIQNAIVSKVCSTVSEKWGADLKIKSIYLSPLLKLHFNELSINDLRDREMITVAKAKARVKSFDLSPFQLNFQKVELEDADVMLTKYRGDSSVNIALWARKLANGKGSGFQLFAKHLEMKNGRFLYKNEAVMTYNGISKDMDYAYFELDSILLNANNFQIIGADISAQIKNLSFSQYTGFHLSDASADFQINNNGLHFNNGQLHTPNSNISLDLNFLYSHWSNYGDFLDSINIEATVYEADMDISDIACFAPALRGMNQKIRLKTHVNGCVNNLYINDLNVNYKEKTTFSGQFHFVDIPDFYHAWIDADLSNFQLSIDELMSFRLPGAKPIPLPEHLRSMTITNGQLAYHGSVKSFDTQIAAKSNWGNLKLNLSTQNQANKIKYQGNISSSELHLGKILQKQKLLGGITLNVNSKGTIPLDRKTGRLLIKNIKSEIEGKVNHLDFIGYPVKNIDIHAQLNEQDYKAEVISQDTNICFKVNAHVDLQQETPDYSGTVKIYGFYPHELAKHHVKIDSSHARGLDQLIYFAQQHENLKLSVHSIDLRMNGDHLENLNGYAGFDKLYYREDETELYCDVLRLTSISTQSEKRFILVSDFLNGTLSTNYPLKSLSDTLKSMGYRYFPNLITSIDSSIQHPISTTYPNGKEGFLNLSVETFRSRSLLNWLLPGLQISPRSTFDLHVSSLKEKDRVSLISNKFIYKDLLRISNINLSGKCNENGNFKMSLNSDSIILPTIFDGLMFRDILLNASIEENKFNYDLQWFNLLSITSGKSMLSGYVDARNQEDIKIGFYETALNLNHHIWSFNQNHLIHLKKSELLFENLMLESGKSHIDIHGNLSFKKEKDQLDIRIKNVDLKQFNNLVSRMNLTFGGDLSSKIRIFSWKNQRLVAGDALVENFEFNREQLGDLFLSAFVPSKSAKINFEGGLFEATKGFNSAQIDTYGRDNFKNEPYHLADIQGFYLTTQHQLEVKATVDTVNIGFLQPFLSSFANRIKGTAQGELAYYANPDSNWFEGNVSVINGQISIAPLNTIYFLKNQRINFNSRGIEFPDISLTDAYQNKAKLAGYVHHRGFKNMNINIHIETDKILALNTPKAANVSFYGTAFASGKISITGGSDRLFFKGTHLRTLPGTIIYLPITFSESVSETEGIRFKIDPSLQNAKKNEWKSSSILDFDFLFDITKDAEVNINLDPSIGGNLTAHTEGSLQLTYNSRSDLNMRGLLTVVSGKFMMSFADLFLNMRLDLVQGGTISFNGLLEETTLAAKALYRTTANINPLLNHDGSSRTQVDAFLHLDGPLMKPEISFSFAFPNVSDEENLRLNNALNAGETNSAATQFFSLLLISSFATQSDQLLSGNNLGQDATSYGLGMLAASVSNMFNRYVKNVDFGLDLQGSNSNDMNVHLNFSAPIWNDRIIFKGNVGYANNRESDDPEILPSSSNMANNWMGGASIEMLLNKSGNWRGSLFWTNDDYYYQENANDNKGTGGGSISYQVEFNNTKEFLDSFRRKDKKDKQERKVKNNNKRNAE